MNALILVGGEGTRLRPLTYDVAKPMLPVVERPIIARILEWLARFGTKRAVLSLGYRPDQFIEGFPDANWQGVVLDYAVEPEPMDTAGAIRFAAQASGMMDEQLIIINGDILTDLDLDELFTFHRDRESEATIALTPVEDPSAFGVVATTKDGLVLAFVEKPRREQAPTNLINAGTYIFEPSVLERIESGRRVSVEREIFPAMVNDGALYAMSSDAYWVDTGTPERYVQAQIDILSGRRPHVIVPDHHEIAPGVRVVSQGSSAGKATGQVFVGADAVVAANASLHNCVIGPSCVIGDGAVVRNAVVLHGAQLGSGVVCQDSIIGADARIGSHARLVNWTVVGNGAEVSEQESLDSARVPV